MADKNNIKEKDLDKVAGGSFFSEFSDAEYQRAGVEVVNPGFFINGGYKYQGKDITDTEASILVYFYQEFGRKADSVQEANNWFTYQI